MRPNSSGIWSITPLPVERAQILAALDALKAAPLFKGARGRTPINRELVADAIVSISNAALALGPRLHTLEINPLAVAPDHAGPGSGGF